jgi:hypothetical protein
MKNMRKREYTNNSSKLPIGEWKIGDDEHFISFALKKKPNGWHRFWVRVFFGLRWIDFKTPHEVKPSKGIQRGIVKEIPPSKRIKR